MTTDIASESLGLSGGSGGALETPVRGVERKKKGPRPKYGTLEERNKAIKDSQDRYRTNQKKHGLKFYQRAVTAEEIEVLDKALDAWRVEKPLPTGMFVRKPRRKSAASA